MEKTKRSQADQNETAKAMKAAKRRLPLLDRTFKDFRHQCNRVAAAGVPSSQVVAYLLGQLIASDVKLYGNDTALHQAVLHARTVACAHTFSQTLKWRYSDKPLRLISCGGVRRTR